MTLLHSKLPLCHCLLPITIHDTTFFTWNISDVLNDVSFMKEVLKWYPEPILFYCLTNNISEMQYNSYNTILVLWCKIMQHNTGRKHNTGSKHNNGILSNNGKLAKMVDPDSFGEEPSSLRLRKLMIAGNSLWWRYKVRMARYPLHPFPYPQPIISTSIAYWQALWMHRF